MALNPWEDTYTSEAFKKYNNTGSDFNSGSYADFKITDLYNGRINPDVQMQNTYTNLPNQSKGIFGNLTPDFLSGITGDGMKGVGSLIGGIGGLAQGWASLKNARLARDAYDTQKDQWQQNYESQRTAVNNQIANQNAWKQAQGRQDYGSYVGGKPSGTNYVG
tara:strand:- start:526 stop:1014 length:489 start_codon:yes stop_codon:yes gene_type:complete